MNIDELETIYLTENQIEELSESEKVHLITRLMAAKEQNDA